MNIAGCVVLYNPDDSVVENIRTYAPLLGKLYVADNSDDVKRDILDKILSVAPGAMIIPMNGNKGIAAALNKGLKGAAEDGFDYLLTMDDDSHFEGDVLKNYLVKAEKLFSENDRVIQVGIHNTGDKDFDTVVNSGSPEWLITSGTVMDVKKSVEIGGFLEELFIDEVDREFCYRAADMGYCFRRVLDLTMNHNLGAPIKGKFLWKTYEAMGHSKIRKYYIYRNCTYIMQKYPSKKKEYKSYLQKMFIKTLLAEDDKLNKIKYMKMGVRDAKNGKFGKLEV